MTQMGMKEVIVLNAKNDDKVSILMKELQTEFHPEITFLVSDDQEKLVKLAPFTKDYQPIEQATTVYVCENFVCNKPTTNMDEAIELIRKKK